MHQFLHLADLAKYRGSFDQNHNLFAERSNGIAKRFFVRKSSVAPCNSASVPSFYGHWLQEHHRFVSRNLPAQHAQHAQQPHDSGSDQLQPAGAHWDSEYCCKVSLNGESFISYPSSTHSMGKVSLAETDVEPADVDSARHNRGPGVQFSAVAGRKSEYPEAVQHVMSLVEGVISSDQCSWTWLADDVFSCPGFVSAGAAEFRGAPLDPQAHHQQFVALRAALLNSLSLAELSLFNSCLDPSGSSVFTVIPVARLLDGSDALVQSNVNRSLVEIWGSNNDEQQHPAAAPAPADTPSDASRSAAAVRVPTPRPAAADSTVEWLTHIVVAKCSMQASVNRGGPHEITLSADVCIPFLISTSAHGRTIAKPRSWMTVEYECLDQCRNQSADAADVMPVLARAERLLAETVAGHNLGNVLGLWNAGVLLTPYPLSPGHLLKMAARELHVNFFHSLQRRRRFIKVQSNMFCL